MYQDALRKILQVADAQSSSIIGYRDVASWPTGALGAFVEAGLLKQSDYASSVVCDGCEEACLEDVEFIGGDDQDLRAYLICSRRDDMGRVKVPLNRLRRWVVDLGEVADRIGKSLGCTLPAKEIAPGRLWWLGGPSIGRRRVDIFLARGGAWPGATDVFGQVGLLQECSAPLILALSDVPSTHPFGPGAKAISLPRVLSFQNDALQIDITEVERIVGKGRSRRIQPVVPFPTPPGTAWKNIVIEFINDGLVKITAGSRIEHKTYEEMGFRDRRKKDEEPDVLWVLLRSLAKFRGRISWEEDLGTNQWKIKRHVTDLRKRLMSYFGIPQDPFEPYRKEKAYRTKFVIRDTRPSSR